jgi:hypothetical protein
MNILKKKGFGDQTEIGIKSVLGIVELIIAALAVVVVILGAIYLILELPSFWHDMADHALHGALEDFLSDILLVVVGVELVIMLILRTPESLLDVMFFVIARKMLIKTSEFYELLIGVAALAALFATRKFLGYVAIRQQAAGDDE